MAAAIPLRSDYHGARLREFAKASQDANQTRRLLALAVIYDGGKRGEAAALAGVGLQVVRDWVLRFNAEGPAGLIDRKPPGATPKLDADQRAAVARMVESGPIPAVHGVVRWRLKDLGQWIFEEFGVALDDRSIGRLLARMGFCKLSVRPRHYAQSEAAVADFKKGASPPSWRRSARVSRLEPR